MENQIGLKAIEELQGMKFFIPNYQRGYRWTSQQVRDLLEDLNDFKKEGGGFYCLQPLVVKKREKDIFKKIKEDAQSLDEVKQLLKEDEWEVIDGQQRLTTIFIILSCLNVNNSYSLEYETRKGSASFLKDISESKSSENIDYYHIHQAKKTIKDWLDPLSYDDRKTFKEKLLSDVKFIWYDSVDNPIQVFTRLNIGKISLTNAELIKALFLNHTNFSGDSDYVKLRQLEIANEWDCIEYTLQNDEFWLFLHEKGYDRPTRIDFIFDLICNQNLLDLDPKNDIGTDSYKTFRYFYEYFRTEKQDIYECWEKVKTYYQIFQEWYDDLELYHYIGYLMAQPSKGIHIDIGILVSKWRESNDKAGFVAYLKKEILDIVNKVDVDRQYSVDGADKRKCLPILLFHNIQTVINQNRTQRNNGKYQLGTFYKFPFHLFKLEAWDVEHINSSTENPENDIETQKEWLLNVYIGADDATKENIRAYFEKADPSLFDTIKKSFRQKEEGDSEDKKSTPEEWRPEDKNRIWNYTLLDSSTNRSYGNAIFSGKRRVIIGKDKGKYIAIPKLKQNGDLELGKEEDARSSFVPPCTKHVFLKYYSPIATDNNYWTKNDADAYLEDIKDCLKILKQ